MLAEYFARSAENWLLASLAHEPQQAVQKVDSDALPAVTQRENGPSVLDQSVSDVKDPKLKRSKADELLSKSD